MPKAIPQHLKKYISTQAYSRYTSKDHAIWRYIMRQLKFYLRKHAHSCYIDGLKKTGISTDQIPKISDMDKKLRRFGWGAIPVSGFIPPAAFMEFQSLGYLPIASELRTIEHAHYTPAPDIVHEAAGHAPIIIDKRFSDYLKAYAEVAAKAIISQEDLNVYEAIRKLSDAKERPDASPSEIAALEKSLEGVTGRLSNVSEAGLLSRMNWWTAEYGLIGSIENPKIYGAGLLSSIGESRECLGDKVKKIPMSVHCIDYTYDITEPQPQLFVTKDFKELNKSLDDLANQMAFRRGGKYGLDRAIEASTVNTLELDSGIQISGRITEYIAQNDVPVYVRITGPAQLSYQNQELPKQGKSYHKEGYSTPVGKYKLSGQLKSKNSIELNFASGVSVSGVLQNVIKKGGKPILLTLKPCTVKYEGKILYEPSWGPFDLALGAKIVSVFGGPADRKKYVINDDFVAPKIPKKIYSSEQKELFKAYAKSNRLRKEPKNTKALKALADEFKSKWPSHWLLGLEIYEACLNSKNLALAQEIRSVAEVHCPAAQAQLLQDGILIATEKL